MAFTNIQIERDEAVATLTINRPKSLNALNRETLEEMLACLKELSENRSVQVLIITGSGEKAFVAGADISFS